MGNVNIIIVNQGFFPAHPTGQIVIEEYGRVVRTYTQADFKNGNTVMFSANYASGGYRMRVLDDGKELDGRLVFTITRDETFAVDQNGQINRGFGGPTPPPLPGPSEPCGCPDVGQQVWAVIENLLEEECT